MLNRFNFSVNLKGVTMHAADSFDKAEKSDIFKQGYIKYTGEDSPIFIAPDMPKGMQVKNILWLKNGDTVYLNERMAFDKYKDVMIRILEMDSVPLTEIEELTGFNEADHYRLIASDGYTKEIDRETFLLGALFMDQDGLYGINFDGMEKKHIIKSIISIEIVD